MIEEENQQEAGTKETGRETPKDTDDIDEKDDKVAKAKAAEGEGEAKEEEPKESDAASESKEAASSEQANEVSRHYSTRWPRSDFGAILVDILRYHRWNGTWKGSGQPSISNCMRIGAEKRTLIPSMS